MGWLKKLSKALTAKPPKSRRKSAPAKTQRVTAPAKTPKMVPSDFIDLTQGEASLICHLVGTASVSDDTRMTITERLVEAVEDEIAVPSSDFLMIYLDHHEVDAAALLERLRSLSSKQAQCIISAAKRFWKLEDWGDHSETRKLIEVGLVRRRT